MMRSDALATSDSGPIDARPGVASWYTPGFSDGLGDRLLMFDSTTSAPLELLRFKPEFADVPAFEAALRERVEQLREFEHASFARARTVRRLGTTEGLALVSDHTSGRRLSEVLHLARGSGLATKLILRLAPGLAALQEAGPGVAHGALTTDRVIVTPGGGLVIVEHVLGSALAALHLSHDRLRSELGLAVGMGTAHVLDARLDVVQLGHIALSLVTGRKLDPIEDPDRIANLIAELGSTNRVPRHLLIWLERALQVGTATFASARDAASALSAWSGGDAFLPERSYRSRDALFQSELTDTTSGADQDFDSLAAPIAPVPAEPLPRPLTIVPRPVERVGADLAARTSESFADRDASSPGAQTADLLRSSGPWLSLPRARWIIGGLAALALAEGVLVTTLWRAPEPPPAGVVGNAAASPTSAPQAAPAEPPSPPAAPPFAAEAPVAEVPAIVAPPQPVVRTGQLVVTSNAPGAVVVVDGTRRGTTPLTLTLDAGSRDIVISAGGVETRQTVAIRAGEAVTAQAEVPTGSISLTAQPWANVWVNGEALGRTPIANTALAAGTHEVLWRHPELGERRQQIEVTAATPLSLSMNLRE